MSIHEEVLLAVRRLCRERGNWTFTPVEVVRALPHLNERSVRTHIVSRCCINAPRHHPHKWEYFRRLQRGLYELVPKYRRETTPQRVKAIERVAETNVIYGASERLEVQDSVHVAITRGEKAYVAECLEISVVTEGATLDEMVYNLREAVALHLEGEDLGALGLSSKPRLVFTWELPLENVTKT